MRREDSTGADDELLRAAEDDLLRAEWELGIDLSGLRSGNSLDGTIKLRVDRVGKDLSGADLTEAKLRNADLTDTDLTGATLTGAVELQHLIAEVARF